MSHATLHETELMITFSTAHPHKQTLTDFCLSFAGNGADWAVSPLSRILTVLYLLVGLPIMYLYLMSTGSLTAKILSLLIRGIMCQSASTSSTSVSSRRASNSSKHSTPQHNLSADVSMYNDKRSTWQTRSSLAARSFSSQQISGSSSTISTPTAAVFVSAQRPSVGPPIVSCLLLLLVYMLTGAAVIAEAQSWSFNDALYFAFVSLFTIGFGGSRPSEPNLWVCALYLFFGASLMSACGHLVYQEVILALANHRQINSAKKTNHRRGQILLTEMEAGKSELS